MGLRYGGNPHKLCGGGYIPAVSASGDYLLSEGRKLIMCMTFWQRVWRYLSALLIMYLVARKKALGDVHSINTLR